MNNFGKKSAAYICYEVVNIWWYLSCIVGALFPALLVYEYLQGSHPDSIFGISVPLATSLVSLKNPAKNDFLKVDALKGQVDFGYILQNNPYTFISWSIFICIFIGLILFAIYQLRELLQTTVNGAVFTKQNVKRIKIIAFLVFLVEPLSWIQHYFIFKTLGSDVIAHEGFNISVNLPFPGGGWTFIILSLLIYTLAAVFEKGHEMYQELKLTV